MLRRCHQSRTILGHLASSSNASVRGGVPSLPVATPLAERVPVPSLHGRSRLANGAWRLDGVRDLPSPDLGYCGNDLRRHAQALDHVVSSHVVGNQPEARAERSGTPARPRPWELSDGVDVAAQASPGHGSSWTRSSVRAGGDWRNVRGRGGEWRTRPRNTAEKLGRRGRGGRRNPHRSHPHATDPGRLGGKS